MRCGARASVDRLDEALWTYKDDAFLPHGASLAEGDDGAADEPIWLTETDSVANEADVLFLVEGGGAEAADLSRFTRCVMIFDGGDGVAVVAARAFWKAVKAAGHDAAYWKQSVSGRWEKQA